MTVSRRGFLGAATAAAGVVATGVGLPSLTSAAGADPADTASTSELEAFSGPVFVHVKNAGTGDVSMLIGSEEITFRDPKLVARLVRAAH